MKEKFIRKNKTVVVFMTLLVLVVAAVCYNVLPKQEGKKQLENMEVYEGSLTEETDMEAVTESEKLTVTEDAAGSETVTEENEKVQEPTEKEIPVQEWSQPEGEKEESQGISDESAKTEITTQPEVEAEPEPQPEAEPQSQPEPQPQAEPQPKAESQPQPDSQPKDEPQPQPKPLPEVEPQSQPESKPKAEPQPKQEAVRETPDNEEIPEQLDMSQIGDIFVSDEDYDKMVEDSDVGVID